MDKVCFSTLQALREEVSFHMFLKKMTPNYLEKEKFRVIMRKKKLLQNLYLKLRNTTTSFFIKQLIQLSTAFRNRFQQKAHIETLKKMEILLLKALRDKDFDLELQQMSSFFSSDLHNFKLESQLETLTHIVDQKTSCDKRYHNNYFIIK